MLDRERVDNGERSRGRGHSPTARRLVWAALVALLMVGAGLGIHALQAQTAPRIFVNPATKMQLYYRPTPITITVEGSGLSGPGLEPVAGYQYALRWDPAVLKWLSGPAVGPGTPTPQPVLPCQQQIVTWGTPTATPPGWVPTFTPTFTPTPTPTSTPEPGTPTNTPAPTNTPTVTNTPTMTPTPGGYIFIGCATISGTAIPSGVLGTFSFQPIATAPAQSNLELFKVMLVNHDATPIPATVTSGMVYLPDCHDINGDGIVNVQDLLLVASGYLKSNGQPGYNPAYDVNNDGVINILDLLLVAGAYLFSC